MSDDRVIELPAGTGISVSPNGLVVLTSAALGRAIEAIARTQPNTQEHELAWARYWLERERLYGPRAVVDLGPVGFHPAPIRSPVGTSAAWWGTTPRSN